jgi:multidrug efflux pump subunit AcrA (membrane-fusion protein)
MPLDTESLGSLRIERSKATSGGGNRTGLYIGIAVVLLVVAAGTWFFMRPKPTEVSTVVAEADSSGPSLGTSVLNASGYVVARRMATVSSKVTGKVLEIYAEI